MGACLSIVVPADGPDVTADAVARRLRERRFVDRRRADERRRILEEQRRQFGQVSSRIQTIGSDVRLKLPELAPLHRLAAEVLEVSKLLFRELDEMPSADKSEVPPATMAELLDRSALQLEKIERQLWLLDSLDTAATGLHEGISELQKLADCPAGRVLQLARRIMIDVDRSSDKGFLRVDSALSLSQFLARRSELKQPAIYASGLEAARLTAWMSRAMGMGAGRRELLMIAALLRDIGLLSLLRRKGSSMEDLLSSKQDLYREHPAMSAAIAAGIREYRFELPALIAQHHERLDGTGYPRRLLSRRLICDSRLLALVSRYVELVERTGLNIPEPASGAAGRLAPAYFAAAQLHREAEQGAFDLPLAIDLLKSLGVEFRETTQFEPGLLRLDAAHATTSGPHFRALPAEQGPSEANVPAPHFTQARARRRSRRDKSSRS